MLSVSRALLGLMDAWAYPCRSQEDYALADQYLDLALAEARQAVAEPEDRPNLIACLTRILAAPRGSEEFADAMEEVNTLLGC